ncbi:MAG TPA: pyruvate/2-oxoglutarate dehydrogenase complex,dihydrolipoamide dehydrogenase (E3) component [Cyanobacteria bacterium UBA8553]|nr:pyruvate/2-oxoglutarate dehydrogenase complex,dihydrolipoamide dehydrogenase (E3) component [Cyanobacteria bacterium UBA8553]HAJ61498.1 pyruvate/2-oxoglutarate dehydrogenase complex,dihydrolipoamide dehydrogenase (E3) component [Cyanobacteria bacterium UBA8543]
MAILDSKGRLFGKVSLLDVGAALVILLVIVGIFFFPGTSGSVAQLSDKKPIEVDVLVRGLSVGNPPALLNQFKTQKKTNIIIRNEPYGQVDIKSVKELPRTILVPQPNGTVKEIPDPRANSFSTDMLMTLGGQATMTKDGPVLGNSKIKIGTPVQLEGINYSFNVSVIDVRIKQN